MVNASDLKSDEQKKFLSVRSRSGVQINQKPFAKASSRERFGFCLFHVLLL